MNKAQFLEFMLQQCKHSKHSSGKTPTKTDADKALTWVTDSIVAALSKDSKDNSVNLVGFGSFLVQTRKQREGRNPQTGAKIMIKEYKQPVFKVGSRIKKACNAE